MTAIRVIDLAKSNQTLETIQRIPQERQGWQSTIYKGTRYRIFGGKRDLAFIDLASPLTGYRPPRKFRRPDAVFIIAVCPVYRVISCPAKLAEESRGLMGFHNFEHCPDCAVISTGWEFWGENGHCQGSATDRPGMVRWIKTRAREQSPMSEGGILGYRFRLGSPIHYRGN